MSTIYSYETDHCYISVYDYSEAHEDCLSIAFNPRKIIATFDIEEKDPNIVECWIGDGSGNFNNCILHLQNAHDCQQYIEEPLSEIFLKESFAGVYTLDTLRTLDYTSMEFRINGKLLFQLRWCPIDSPKANDFTAVLFDGNEIIIENDWIS